MPARFTNIDRNTPMLLPPDLRDWVSEDDYVHFVIQATERLPLESFKINHRGTGSSQYPPHMMLALLVYCYSMGIFSSRKIEQATYTNISVRFLTADTHPDHDSICKFRRENKEAITNAFVDILQLAKEMGLLKVGKVSVDGTHIKASASINQNITYKRAKELKEKLTQDVLELMAQAENADTTEPNNEALPAEIARKEKMISKMDKAIESMNAKAKKEQQKAQDEYEKKREERAEKEKQQGKKLKGAKPKPPEQDLEKFAEESNKTHNFTDSDSQVMRKSTSSAYTQSYNTQAAVDTESYLIVGQHIADTPNDKNELVPAFDSIPEEIGKPEVLIADAGYATESQLIALEDKTDVYVSPHREDAHAEREYDYRPAEKLKSAPKEPKNKTLKGMKEKVETEAGKEIYKLRSKTVETVFGIIKENMRFRSFRLRGEEKIGIEWELICASYNLKRLFNLKNA